METLSLAVEDARKLYADGNESTKKFIEEKFSKELFSTDWLKLWEEFLQENKLSIPLPFPDTQDREQQRTNAHHMLIHIVPIERGNWEPDYDNTQSKYEPIFKISSSGFGFSYYDSDFWHSTSDCGSRLCTPTAKACERIAKKYLPIYQKLLTK